MGNTTNCLGTEEGVLFFFYGSLLQDFYNYKSVVKGNSFLYGKYKTEPIYTMYDGPYPKVERHGETAISGEVHFIIDPSIINHIFKLEGCESRIQGHHSNWYDFDANVKTPWGNAIIFVMDKVNDPNKKIILSGSWLEK